MDVSMALGNLQIIQPDTVSTPEDCRHSTPHAAVAIVGGGLAGCALASLLAPALSPVVLFEKRAYPREKLCGEFLSPGAKAWLIRLGCYETVRAAGTVEITHARFTTPSGRELLIPFAEPGLGLSRHELDAILFRHAQASGALVFDHSEVFSIQDDSSPAPLHLQVRRSGANGESHLQTWTADLVLAAHGKRSRLDRQMRRRFFKQHHPFLALKRHCRTTASTGWAMESCVEIHVVPGGYCGLCKIEKGFVNVCMLLHRDFVQTLEELSWDGACRRLSAIHPILAGRLASLEPVDAHPLSIAQVPFSFKEKSRGPLLFAGDAAGAIAPFCGHGQTVALQSAVLLADLILPHFSTGRLQDVDALARAWNRRWRDAFQFRFALARIMQQGLCRPLAAEALLRLFQRFPSLTPWAVHLFHGH